MGLDRKSIEASHIWFDMWCWETPFVNKQGVTKLTFTRNIKGATFECTSYRSVFLITWPKYEKFLLSPSFKNVNTFHTMYILFTFPICTLLQLQTVYVNSNPTSMQSDLFHNGLYLDIASHYIQRILNRFSTYVFYTVYILKRLSFSHETYYYAWHYICYKHLSFICSLHFSWFSSSVSNFDTSSRFIWNSERKIMMMMMQHRYMGYLSEFLKYVSQGQVIL